jgi:hypothetical protein
VVPRGSTGEKHSITELKSTSTIDQVGLTCSTVALIILNNRLSEQPGEIFIIIGNEKTHLKDETKNQNNNGAPRI